MGTSTCPRVGTCTICSWNHRTSQQPTLSLCTLMVDLAALPYSSALLGWDPTFQIRDCQICSRGSSHGTDVQTSCSSTTQQEWATLTRRGFSILCKMTTNILETPSVLSSSSTPHGPHLQLTRSTLLGSAMVACMHLILHGLFTNITKR